jgi:hypothetical protein
MIKEIKKSEIPEWEHGDIGIKTYSYGNLLAIQDMSIIENGKITARLGYKDSDIGIMVLAAGLHYVRNTDGSSFIIKSDTPLEDKKKFCLNIDTIAAKKILDEIKILNDPLTEQEKK